MSNTEQEHFNVIIIEDSASDAELIERRLRKAGFDFDARIVENREEFTRALDELPPDFILSDHSLPQFNSLEALRIFKSTGLKIPFILVTGSVSEEFAVQCIQEGAHDYILKDRMARLPAAIHNALEKCRIENERQKYFEAVLANEALLKETEMLAHIASWQTNLLTGVSFWSDEAFRIYGYAPGSIQPSFETFMRHVFSEDLPMVNRIIHDSIERLNELKVDFRIVDSTGVIKNIRSMIVIKRDETGKPIHLTGFNQDVTESKLNEEKLKQSELRYREFFETAPEAILVLDSVTGKFAEYNHNALKLLKYSSAQLQDKTIEDISPPFQPDGIRSAERVREVLIQVTNGEKPIFEWLVVDANGHSIFCEIRLTLITSPGSNLIRTSVIDISDRKNAEIVRDRVVTDIVQRNKDLEQFSYIVSHNLRAPVANILGITQTIQECYINHKEVGDLIDGLSEASIQLDDVIRDLNEILKVRQNINEERRAIRFDELVKSIEVSISDQIENKDITIVTDFKEAGEMFSLKTYLYSIFYNLISNSIKYRRSQVPLIISICSKKLPDGIELKFKDNGMGIDLQTAGDRLFGLYKRFHHEIEGKGMGLFMVKTQVEMLRGTISAESKLNEGTEFTIAFINE